MKKLISILLFFLILSGCTTQIFFSRNVPPEIVPEKKPARILFVNQFDYRSSPAIKEKHDTAYQAGITEFVDALVSNSLKGGSVIFFPGDSTGITDKPDLLEDNLIPAEKIKALCISTNADFMLVLDSLYLGFDWETFTTEDDDGSKMKTKNIYLHANYYVSLYHSEGGLTKRTVLAKNLLYASRGTLSGLITFVPNLARCLKEIEELANDAGSQYLGMFYPSTVDEMRTLNTGKIFAESNSLIRNQQYKKAIELLEKITGSPKKSVVKKARHNLMVANEINNPGIKQTQIIPIPFMNLKR